eukprot:4212410-Heterocapsa_arctica.AAC.1
MPLDDPRAKPYTSRALATTQLQIASNSRVEGTVARSHCFGFRSAGSVTLTSWSPANSSVLGSAFT